MSHKLYNALGLNKCSNPSQNDIKRAYKKMAMEHHPDKNKDNPEAEEKFKNISHAYNILSDDKKKNIYDQVGDEGYNNEAHQHHHHSMNQSDIFEQFFNRQGSHEDFASHFGFGGFHNQQQHENNTCNSQQKVMSVTLEEAFKGISKNIKINITKYCHDCMIKCVNCDGSGIVKQIKNMGVFTQIFTAHCDKCDTSGYCVKSNNKNCSDCKGNGKYTKEINAFLNIPAGIEHGYKTAFQEMGEQPKNPNKKAGDLILEIQIEEHKKFKRQGNDLHYKTSISFIDSIIGKDIVIECFNEDIKLNTNIFGVVNPSKKYLIENKGMPILNTANRGNMYIEFTIVYPKIKNKDEIDKLSELLTKTFYD